MKRLFYVLSLLIFLMVSCGPDSNMELIHEYEVTGNAAVEALKAGNKKEADNLFAECEELVEKLQSRDLSQEEEQEFIQINLSIMEKVIHFADSKDINMLHSAENDSI